MAQQGGEVRGFSCSDLCPCTPLFRGFKLAVDARKLALAFAALLLIYLVGRGLDLVWAESSRVVVDANGVSEVSQYVAMRCNHSAACDWKEAALKMPGHERIGIFAALVDHARHTVWQISCSVFSFSVTGLISAIVAGFGAFCWLCRMHPGYAVIFLPLALVIWAFFSGAICRIAALDATRGERISIRDSLTFARGKFVGFLTAPLLPLGLLIGVVAALFLGGLIGAIPGFGTLVTPLLWFLAIIGGLVGALLLIGLAVGWPLMFPTIAVEGGDAFEALSRSFNYIAEKPWRTALYAVLAVIYGAICFAFVKFFVRVALFLVHLGVGMGMNIGSASGPQGDVPNKLDAFWKAPALDFTTPFYGEFGHVALSGVSRFGAFLVACWTFAVVTLVASFLVTYFHSASTLIYLLLRRDVDATDIEEVYVEEEEGGPESGSSSAPSGPSGDDDGGPTLARLPVVGGESRPPEEP